jgi:NADH dehydrogenase
LKKVIVIGGGYGGLRAVEKLIKDTNIEIILIDKNPYHYLQTEAYGYVAGKFDICDITLDIKSWTDGFNSRLRFINDEVIEISTNKKEVITKNQILQYDDVIIAIGAKTNFPTFIKGLRENSHGIKVLERAYHFKSEFEKIIYKKVNKHDKEEFNVVIGGAGLSGVEIAAEMAYIASKFTKSIGIKESKIHIYLVEAYDSILNGMDSYIIDNTMKRLESLGVKVMLNSFIEEVEPHNIILKDKSHLPFDFMIFTGGIKAYELPFDIELSKNKMGQFLVNEYLQLDQNCYAIGDCTELKDSTGQLLPPTAQSAEQSAAYVAKSISDKYKNEKIKPYIGRMDGIFVALGGNYAVGQMLKYIKVKGYSAYLLKKLITKLYHYGLKSRFNNSFKIRG